MIPRFKPWIGWPELKVLFRCNSGAVEKFERKFALQFEAESSVSFSYGRSALWAFLRAMNIKDAEVVVSAYTCSVVAHAITLSQNRARFVDIQLSDYNMNLDLLPAAINDKTRAVVATHLFGYPVDLDRLEAIIAEAEAKYGQKIWLIQDCAHSFGASWRGRLVTTSGDVAVYGLNISKMMTSIFGGMLTFQDPELAAKVREWRNANCKKPSWFKGLIRRLYVLAVWLAFNEKMYGLTWWLQEKTPILNRLTKSYHLDDQIHFPPDHLDEMLDVEAAVGIEQLKKYPIIIERRRAIADYYHKNLENKHGWTPPPIVEGATYSHYVVRVPSREQYLGPLADKGLQIGELIQYSIPALSSYSDTGSEAPVSKLASQTVINIPIALSDDPNKCFKVAKIISEL